MKFLIQFICLFGVSFSALSQQVFWVTFASKDPTYAVSRPEEFLSRQAIARRFKYSITIDESDLPVNSVFIGELKAKGYKILSKSKWLNAVAINVPQKEDEQVLKKLSFVRSVKYLGEHRPVKSSGNSAAVDMNEVLTVMESKFEQKSKRNSDSVFYGKTYHQVSMLNLQKLHDMGYWGNDINIAVIDAGFNSVHRLPVFKQLLDSHRIKSTVDFVQKDSMVFEDDDHGMSVLSCMAGFIPYKYVGTAPFANYYLLRSEYSITEMPVEETFWAEAAEYADSCGVDMINSSLGYNEFDDATLSHTYKELNGRTAIISKAASIAVSKGIVMLNSAGNEGNDPWMHISVPADVAEVITVGGVDEHQKYASFSSIGPASDKRIKPDVMAMGDNTWVASSRGVFYAGDGTSYACPVMTGAVACLLQANPGKSPAQIMEALHMSGNKYHSPDKYMGYGVPDLYLAHLILKSDSAKQEQLIDCRVLSGKSIDMAYYIPAPQKITVTLKNTNGEIVSTETVSLKKEGIHRFPLKKASKKLKRGLYTVQVISKTKDSSQTVNY
jgi:serine protease AprX